MKVESSQAKYEVRESWKEGEQVACDISIVCIT